MNRSEAWGVDRREVEVTCLNARVLMAVVCGRHEDLE